MRKVLLILGIILLVVILIFGGLAFALRPPHKVFAPQGTDDSAEMQTVLTEYIMEQAAVALDGYTGEGDLVVSLEQNGLSQALADALRDKVPGLPGGLKYTGIFTDVHPDYVEIGAGLKLLFIPIGASARLQVTAVQDEIELNLLSVHLGRIRLPLDFFLNATGKYVQLPLDTSTLSTSIPMDLGEEMGITLADLDLEPGNVLVSLQLDEGVIPEIPDETVESFKESIPEMYDVLADNPVAAAALKEIEDIVEQAQADGKKVNPLRLKILAEKLYGSLIEEEFKLLEKVLNDEVKELLAGVQN